MIQFLPFKSSFFSAAEQTESSILPICIKYKEVNEQPINNSNRDLIYYYEQEVDFFEHFFRMLTTHSINVEVNFLDKIDVDSKTDRKKLSQKTYELILSEYKK